MKPIRKFNRIYREKLKKCLVFYIGVFLCMYWTGISEGAKCGRPGRTQMNDYEPFGDEFNWNDRIRYFCKEHNHVILGNPERRCLTNGSWSDDIPVCSKVTIIEKIELMFQDSNGEDQSFQAIDGDVSTCSKASIYNRTNWNIYLAVSTDITAVRISFIGMKEADIDVQVQEGNSDAGKKCKIKSHEEELSLKSITTVTFYCPAETTGKFIRVSCKNLSLALCEISVLESPSSTCLSPDIPLHGNGFKTFVNGQKTTYIFNCHAGYGASGELQATCQADGRWSPKSPLCQEIYCHPPESIENGAVEYTANKWKVPYNGTAKYSCREGFYLSGVPVIRCHKFQRWDFPPPECKIRIWGPTTPENTHPYTQSWKQSDVVHCGNLPQIANGALIINSSHVGSTAWLKCSEGFRPLTDDHIICLPTGKWSLHSLHCTTIQCEDKPVIPHGNAILLNNSSYYGSYLQVKCNQGYASQTDIIRKCDEHGSWGDLNICIEITCGSFNKKDVNSGQWLPVNGSASLYVLICSENFHIEGSPALIRCLSNGSWSYTSARCQKSFTSFWGSNWTPSLVLIVAVVAGIATAIVILCLSVAFFVIKKRRQAQTNTTVFHLENTAQKDRIRQINPQRQKHHSATENYNTVELRCKSTCTIPRKPRSALPNLPIDADPVYAQPFETATSTKKVSVIAANKKDDLYNTHIYAEPVNSRRNTPNHVLVNIDNLRMGTEKRSSVSKTSLENELPISAQTDQQNCDKTCAIYDSSANSSLNTKVTKTEHFQSYNDKIELGTLKKNLEYLELH